VAETGGAGRFFGGRRGKVAVIVDRDLAAGEGTAVASASDDSSFLTGTELFVDGGAAQVSDLSRESNIDPTRLREELGDEHK
jgi:hypothetical protein